MKTFFRCYSAEWLKMKRSISLLAALALPTILTLFNFLLILGVSTPRDYSSPTGWVAFEHNTITFWALLVFPYTIVLLAAFNAHQEHDTHRWRQLMCLPLPKVPLYLAKFAAVTTLSFLSCLTVWLENILLGFLLSFLRPEVGLSLANITLFRMLIPYLFIFLLSLLILAIHFWFSMRVQNFVLSIGLGFALGLVGAFLRDQGIWNFIFPWALPSLVYTVKTVQEIIPGLAYSLVGFVIFTAAGCLSFIRRDVLS
jgi:hypothetical protein